MGSMFSPALRHKKKLRLLLAGPTFSGKTRTALRFAFGIVDHELKLRGENRAPKIVVIDTEHGRASFEKGKADDGVPYNFLTCELPEASPQAAVAAMKEAWAEKVDAVIIDSEAHFWAGSGGVLKQHREIADRRKDKNSYAAWQDAGAIQDQFIEAQLLAPFHIIATVRQKMKFVQERGADGKTVIRCIGLKDTQRRDFRYEFDVVGNITADHELTIVKTPWDEMPLGPVVKPGASFIIPLIDWLNAAEGDYERHEFPAMSPDAAASIAAALAGPTPKENLAAAVAATVANRTSAQSAGGTAAPAAAGAVTSTVAAQNLASDVQVSEITVAIQALELKGQPAAMLAKRGVVRLEDLTKQQAEEILTTLRAKVQARKAELDTQLAAAEKANPTATASTITPVVAAHTVASASSPDPTPISTPTAPSSRSSASESMLSVSSTATTGVENSPVPADPDLISSISEEDQKRILAYCRKLQIGDADLARILGKRQTKSNPPHSVRSVSDLSHNQAQDMIGNLRAALLKRFPDSSPF